MTTDSEEVEVAMKINDLEIEDRTEIWSVVQASTDGDEREIACPDGEVEARTLQKAFGGKLQKRLMFVTAPVAVAEESDAALADLL